MIGVNAQIESDAGGNDGVGFAIPSNTVAHDRRAADRERLGRARLPRRPAPGDSGRHRRRDRRRRRCGRGRGSPRHARPKAGLKAATGEQTVNGIPYPTGGDVITAADGESVNSADDLQKAIDAKKPGDTIELTVVNGDQTRTVTVTLGTRPAQ